MDRRVYWFSCVRAAVVQRRWRGGGGGAGAGGGDGDGGGGGGTKCTAPRRRFSFLADHSDSSFSPSSSHVVRWYGRRAGACVPAFRSFVFNRGGEAAAVERAHGRRAKTAAATTGGDGARVTSEPTTAPVQRRLRRRSDVFVSACESYLFLFFFLRLPHRAPCPRFSTAARPHYGIRNPCSRCSHNIMNVNRPPACRPSVTLKSPPTVSFRVFERLSNRLLNVTSLICRCRLFF